MIARRRRYRLPLRTTAAGLFHESWPIGKWFRIIGIHARLSDMPSFPSHLVDPLRNLPGERFFQPSGPRKKSRTFFSFFPLQAFEIPRNHQRNLWKNLAKASESLEKFGKSLRRFGAISIGLPARAAPPERYVTPEAPGPFLRSRRRGSPRRAVLSDRPARGRASAFRDQLPAPAHGAAGRAGFGALSP
jgi:hypothetical protein